MILAQHPHSRPKKIKKSPAPRFHAATQDRRLELYEGYAWFVDAYRRAAEKLKAGGSRAALSDRMLPAGAAVRQRVG